MLSRFIAAATVVVFSSTTFAQNYMGDKDPEPLVPRSDLQNLYRRGLPTACPLTNLGIALALLICLSLVSTTTRGEEPSLAGLPPGDHPLEVSFGFNLINISDVNEKEETLDFEGAIYLEWQDTRLQYDPEDYGMSAEWPVADYSRAPGHIYQGDYAVKELFLGWRPHVVIPNGIANRQISNMAISIWPDGRVAYAETFYAKVETPMDLRRFPFDTQQLEIFIHPFFYEREEFVLVPASERARTWDTNIGIADWARGRVTLREQAASVSYFREAGSPVSEVVATVEIKRRPMHVIISIILPMVLLVSLTWCVFWMDNESLANRVSITFIGILSVVTYYFVVLEKTPEVSYLTLIDALVISTFLVLAAGVVIAVVMEHYIHDNRQELAERVDRICRWAFPLTYLLISVLMAVAFLSFY